MLNKGKKNFSSKMLIRGDDFLWFFKTFLGFLKLFWGRFYTFLHYFHAQSCLITLILNWLEHQEKLGIS